MIENLYTQALPRRCSLEDRASDMTFLPHVDPAERSLRHVDRRFALMRLTKFFIPAARHLRFGEAVDMLIETGYEHRNPGSGNFERRAGIVAKRARSIKARGALPQLAAPSLTCALIGAPGMGKSRTIDLTLARYDQVVRHTSLPTQVIWLKLECPKRGSIRSLCLQFLMQLSALVGNTDYMDMYGVASASDGELQNIMAMLANFHGLGMLIVDEIQHIGRSGDGEHELMTFLTSLSNQLRIPVLFIGTLSVLGQIEKTGRMARRSVGVGSATWEPLKRGDEWDSLFATLWRHQWTSQYTEPTAELADAFYTASGGIHDLLIKLFLATQLRLIYRSEVRGTDDEVITPDFVQQVARVDFRPVKHIVEALVNGDDRKLRRFDDMHAFDEQFRASMLDLTGPAIAPRLLSSQAAKEKQDAAKIELGDHYQIVWSRLQKMGLGDDIILRVIDAARAEGFDAEKDLLGFYEKVLKLKAKAKRRPRPGNNLNIDALDPGDLRYIVLNASKSGMTAFEALLEKGLRGLAPDIPEH
jgi:hypothetical protein